MRNSPRHRRRERSGEAARPVQRTLSRERCDVRHARFMNAVIGPSIRPAARARAAASRCGRSVPHRDRHQRVRHGADRQGAGVRPPARHRARHRRKRSARALYRRCARRADVARRQDRPHRALARIAWPSLARHGTAARRRTHLAAGPAPRRHRQSLGRGRPGHSAHVDLRCPACCSNSRRTIRTMATTMQTNTNHSAST